MHILSTILFLFFLLIASVVLFVLRMAGSVFGTKNGHNKHGRKNRPTSFSAAREKKKIFDKDDGEYVDFEEIK